MKKLATILLLLVILSSVPLLQVNGNSLSDDDNDGIDDDIEDAEERELRIETEDNTITVHSEFGEEPNENEFEISFAANEGIKLELGYSTEINATEYELELQVEFEQLVEFIDQNADGVYNPGEAVSGGTIDLTSRNYSDPILTQITSDDGELGYQLEAHIINESYTFQIIANIFPTYAVLNESFIYPTEMKITIVIENFPYQEDGALALIAEASAEREIETESHETEEEIEIHSDTISSYYSWLKEAIVDGEPAPVNSSVIDSSEGSLIVLSYPHGTNILHDPKLGIAVLPLIPFPLITIEIVLGTAIIAIVLVAIAVIAIRRKRTP
ncbi:MAG: hypothetical protein ACFE89_12180 [Candidatus Hodarchaeota archaeon]